MQLLHPASLLEEKPGADGAKVLIQVDGRAMLGVQDDLAEKAISSTRRAI